MAASVITGKIQDIAAGTTARAMLFESVSDPSFDTGGIVTLNTQKTVTCGSDGTFSVTLHAGSYRIVVADTFKRSVWFITIPTDNAAYDISAVRVEGIPSPVTSYYTAAAIDALIASIPKRLFQTGTPITSTSGGSVDLIAAGAGSKILAAGFFAANKGLRVRGHGVMSCSLNCVTGISIGLPFAGVTPTFTAPVLVAAPFWIDFLIVCRSAGASGLIECGGKLAVKSGAAALIGGTDSVESTTDTTAAITIGMAGNQSVQNDTITMRALTIESIP
jgi:hypothetical protein